MLQLSPQSIIFVATSYVDFRKGIDGLAAFCKNTLGVNPLSGSSFLFYNRALTTIKILTYEGQGYILFTKRLSSGKFKACPKSLKINTKLFASKNDHSRQICHRLLYVLINNGDPSTVKFSKDWKNLRSSSD